ncbi:MAG: hypothetical protein AAFO07_14270 [Bacteroidota bacterium]
MYNFLVRNGQAVAFLLGVAITVIFLISVVSGISAFNMLPEDQQDQTSIFDVGLYGAIVLVIVAAIGMLVFGLFQIATNLKGSVKGLIGLAVLVIIFIVAYTSANGVPEGAVAAAADKAGGLSPGNLKFIGGAITTTLILIGIAALAFVFSEIRNFFK